MSLVIGGVLVLLIAGAAYFFFAQERQSDPVPKTDSVSDVTVDVTAEVVEAVETPADKLPETNPFSGYKNPFE